MKRKKINIRNKIVRGITYTFLCIGAELPIIIMATTIIDKLFF